MLIDPYPVQVRRRSVLEIAVAAVTLTLAVPATALLVLEGLTAAVVGDFKHNPGLHHCLAVWANRALVLGVLSGGCAFALLLMQSTAGDSWRYFRRIVLLVLVVVTVAAGYARWQFEAVSSEYQNLRW